jgi:hypothetical protein
MFTTTTVFNVIQPQSCGEVYLEALNSFSDKFGYYIILLVITVLADAVAWKLYGRKKISFQRYIWVQKITLPLRILWIFTIAGLLFFQF